MTDRPISPAEAEEKLWEALKDTRTGMLGAVDGEPTHFQPMTGFEEPEANRLWFFTRDDTDLARSIGAGRQAMYNLVTKDASLYACLSGRLITHYDRERIDQYWNPVVAAWYPEGKDDPHLTLLRFQLDDARVWFSDKGPVMFVIEVAKANLTKTLPNLGDQADVTFQ